MKVYVSISSKLRPKGIIHTKDLQPSFPDSLVTMPLESALKFPKAEGFILGICVPS